VVARQVRSVPPGSAVASGEQSLRPRVRPASTPPRARAGRGPVGQQKLESRLRCGREAALGFVRSGAMGEPGPRRGLYRMRPRGEAALERPLGQAGSACSAWSALSVLSARQNSAMAAPR
jgi:hypothetical protein